MFYLVLLIICIVLIILIWRLRLKRLKTYYSPLLGRIEIFEKYNKEKALTINNYVQGISIEYPSVEKSYWGYVSNFVVNFCKNKKSPEILMLGLGANSISALIAKKNPRIQQTVVEIDSEIIRACRDFFNLDKTSNLNLIHEDVYKIFPLLPPYKRSLKGNFQAELSRFPYWKKKKVQKEDSRISKACDFVLKRKKIDCIIVDIFTGKTPFYSEDSSRPEFIMRLYKYLKDDGAILFNRPGTNKNILEDNEKLARFLKTQFKKVDIHLIKDTRGYKNNVIVGVKKA